MDLEMIEVAAQDLTVFDDAELGKEARGWIPELAHVLSVVSSAPTDAELTRQAKRVQSLMNEELAAAARELVPRLVRAIRRAPSGKA
jgi:hypothetical protein